MLFTCKIGIERETEDLKINKAESKQDKYQKEGNRNDKNPYFMRKIVQCRLVKLQETSFVNEVDELRTIPCEVSVVRKSLILSYTKIKYLYLFRLVPFREN